MPLPPFVWQVIFYTVSFLHDMIYRPDPPKTQNFQRTGHGTPTIEKGNPVPVVWGSCLINAPQVIAAANMGVDGIHRSFGLLGFALCRGEIVPDNLDGLLIVRFGGKAPVNLFWDEAEDPDVWCKHDGVDMKYPEPINTNAVIQIRDLNLFQGTAYSGGVEVYGYFHNGSNIEELDRNFRNRIGSEWSPAFRNIAWCWFDGFIGNSPVLPGIEFEVRRCPNNLGLDSDGHVVPDPNIDDGEGGVYDANPAEILYELLTDNMIGLGFTTDEVEKSSFQDLGNTLYDEEFGMSLIWDGLSSVFDIVAEVLKTIGAVLYQGNNGKIAIQLLRAADDSVLTLTESNTISLDMETPSWTAKADNIIIEYPLRSVTDDRITRGSVTANDPSRFAWGSGNLTTKIQYEGIRRADIAEKLAVRDMRILTSPARRFSAECNRNAHDLKPGDVVLITWADYGLTTLRCRVDAVDMGTLNDSTIRLILLEDVFDQVDAAFDSPSSDWTDDDLVVADEDGYGNAYGISYGGV